MVGVSRGGNAGREIGKPPAAPPGGVAPSSQPMPGEASAGSTKFGTPLSIYKGQIVLSHQGLQVYSVVTSIGQIYCHYSHGGRGRAGVEESGSFNVGDFVLVAVNESTPNNWFSNFIVGAVREPIAGDPEIVRNLAVYPQVAGVQAKGGEGVSPKGWVGNIFPTLKRLTNTATGSWDATDGDWVKSSPAGAGVGVEPFRAWIRGSPMAGLSFISDEHITKLVGMNYYMYTMSREYEDRVYGGTMAQIDRRVYYPVDALVDNEPQVLMVDGPMYGGQQIFRTYREKDNLRGGPPASLDPSGYDRVALLHEFRGIDGSYILTSASNIIFQKYVGIRTPMYRNYPDDKRPTRGKVDDFTNLVKKPGGEGQLDLPNEAVPYAPVGDAAELMGAAKGASETVTAEVTGTDDLNAFLDDYIENTIYGPFRKLATQWKFGQPYAALQRGKSIAPCPGQWENLAKSMAFNLDPYGANKRYYFGRSVIGILHDGTVVIQDAGGSSISMANGNIYLTAMKDIISYAGRNQINMAGRDMSHTAARHNELVANEGRMTITAEDQLALIGGNNGYGGVIIESLGSRPESYSTGGSPSAGGIMLKSRGPLNCECRDMYVKAEKGGWTGRSESTGLIILEAADTVYVRSKNGSGEYFFGSSLTLKSEGANLQVGKKTLLKDVELDTMYYQRPFRCRPAGNGDVYAGMDAVVATAIDYYGKVLTGACSNMSLGASFQVEFPSSETLNTSNPVFFNIPVPGWQTAIVAEYPGTLAASTFFKINTIHISYPYPGDGRQETLLKGV